MKGSAKIIAALNGLLADELTAINTYMVHAAMCGNWGYDRLHATAEGRARQEMKHAEALIDRILFLEGVPVVAKLNALHIGTDVKTQFVNDLDAETSAIRAYNTAIALCVEEADNTTRDLLEGHLVQEEEHANYLEAQLAQIEQMGLPQFLGQQIRG